jgi:hypothetical protein
MTYSVNEVQMLAQKAARGAGAHPAQAAHFGRAVVCHLAAGREASDLSAALEALPGGPVQTLPFLPDSSALGVSYTEAAAALDMRPPLPPRLALPDGLFAMFSARAQNTYVPASAHSRAGGAGAGMTDND